MAAHSVAAGPERDRGPFVAKHQVAVGSGLVANNAETELPVEGADRSEVGNVELDADRNFALARAPHLDRGGALEPWRRELCHADADPVRRDLGEDSAP